MFGGYEADMNGLIGHIGVLIGLLGAVVGAVLVAAGLLGHRPQYVRRARLYAYLVLFGALVAVAGMERALLLHDFTLAFVAGNNSRETPILFSITGLWSALQGSILLWATILGGYLALFVRRVRRRTDDPVVAVALLVGLVAAAFFFALMAGPADPFRATVGAIPVDGAGPNALLQDNLLDAVHPVFLYLGFVGFTIPFALAIGSLAAGRIENEWLNESRRFAIYAFAFLSAGIVLGAWWSYDTFGWGGYWGWDPVENAALLPWLTATAYLHSAMVEERRGLLRIWNISLLLATYALTILGTFLTRSGVVQSVHAFSDSDIGPALIGYFAAVVVVGVVLIGWRGDRLRAPGGIDAPVSREGAFLVNNLIFVGIALVVLVGTVFPLFYESLKGQQITIGRPYFDSFTVPLGIALLFFMAVAPALPWRKASTGVLRRRLAAPAWVGGATVLVLVVVGIRGLTPLVAFGLGSFAATSAVRQLVLAAVTAHHHGIPAWRGVFGRANGGMIVHIGIVVIAVGLTAASSFAHEAELNIAAGQTTHFDGHSVKFESWRDYRLGNEQGTEAVILLDGRVVKPRIGVFDGASEGTSTPAIASSPFVDVYLSLTSVPKGTASGAPVDVDIFVQPLIAWLWAGGALVVIGGLLAAAPGRRRRPTDPASIPFPELLPDEPPALVGASAAR
jgi:cytochrome c-type biogenesis protein CcmF